MSDMMVEKAAFKERVLIWASKIETPVNGISMRSMKNKWASFSTAGRLTFDISLLGVRTELMDYVIVHELLHHHVPNHGKLWKSLMILHIGEYKALEIELQSLSH